MEEKSVMFTGIVTDIGTVIAYQKQAGGVRLRIATHYDYASIVIGASIACSGICLTVVATGCSEDGLGWFEVEAWEEALRLTTLGGWDINTRINLERSLQIGDELGGHLVSGHVDGVAQILSKREEGDACRFIIQAPDSLAPFLAKKGSVCLDGVSLTVNHSDQTIFDVLLIRHTLTVTIWGLKEEGHWVNIEIDPLARYAARILDYSKILN